MPPLHVPCCPCSTSATAPAHALRTRIGWRAALFLTIATSTGVDWPSHWAPRSQVHERATGKKWPRRTRTSARCPNAPTPPSSQRGPHLSCPCAAHHPCYAPSRRQGGAAEQPQSEAMEVESTMEARPHAHPPPATPRLPPVSFPGLLRTHRRTSQLHVLTPLGLFALRRISTRTWRFSVASTRGSGLRSNRRGGRNLRRTSPQGSRPSTAQGLSCPQT